MRGAGSMRIVRQMGLGFSLLASAGCALITPLPKPSSFAERLDTFNQIEAPPFEGKVQVHWNQYGVPYIVAESDRDAAFALGMVQAHLRLGQMEIFKRLSSGRLSEMAGPLTEDIDQALRALNFRKAAPEIIQNLPPESKLWLEAFVNGINHYKNHVRTLPHEMVVAGMDNEPWTMEDSIGIGRLGGADINWLALVALLPERSKPGWEKLWQRFANLQKDKAASFSVKEERAESRDHNQAAAQMISQLLQQSGRFGSNSIAIAPDRSKSGHAILANDPHLGFTIPNLWVVAGIHSPSYQVAGMLAVGTPVVALGRNPQVAWGGTNMRQYSSDVVEVTGEKFISETIKIKRRWWLDHQVTIRHSQVGPVISDSALFAFPKGRDFAIRWVGNLPSDEITAYLGVMNAKNLHDVSDAMQVYGVPGQNMLVADSAGNIGHLLGAWFPARGTEFPQDLWVNRKTSDHHWQKILNVKDLPSKINPQTGVLASSNNNPVDQSPTRLGWYFPQDDRIKRIYQLLGQNDKFAIADLLAIQTDSYSAACHKLAKQIARELALLVDDPDAQNLAQSLNAWDGFFRPDSQGALVFHHFLVRFAPEFYRLIGREGEEQLWWRSTFLPEQLAQDLADVPPETLRATWLKTAKDLAPVVAKGGVWGDIHRVSVAHIAGQIPVLGARYQLYDLPINGSNETVQKSANDLTSDRHFTSFGSQSRIYSDMVDLDENYFVLFGGQDGWLNAQNFADQVPLWQSGELIQLPLRLEKIAVEFPFVSTFLAAKQGARKIGTNH